MIRLLVAEDQHLVRGALVALLELEPDFEVVGQAANGRSALELATELSPDVALLDIEMPGPDGITVAGHLRESAPDVRCVIVTTFGRPGYLRRALEAGARGYVLKETRPEPLADMVRRVVRGETIVDRDLAVASLETGPNPLTSRERAVLRAAENGAGVAAISLSLHLSEGTVRNYLSGAIRKTGTSNRGEAAHVARHNGWL